MNIILQPSAYDIDRFGTLAYVQPSERNRVLTTMTAKGIRSYCEQLEKIIEKKRRGK